MSNFLIFTFLGIFTIGNHPSDGGQVVSEFQPEFAEPLENLTVAIGRDATFTCRVRNLQGYRVGWVRADTKAIQAIHTHVITHNPRVSVSNSDHSLWHLHIKGVKEEDRGSYMCQINTDPMISQINFLEVVIPPDFVSEGTVGDVHAQEGGPAKLYCNASGHPEPSIIWRREGGQNITLRSTSGPKAQVSVYEGKVLNLQKVSRADMGPYLCIASNGVPPSISKRIMVSVNFHPVIQVPNQLVGAPINTDVTLECNVEAYPKSIHFWIKDHAGAMIITGDRFEVQEIASSSMFEVKMLLTIRRIRRSDAGAYHCIAKNSLGDVDSVVKLHVLKLPVEPTEDSSSKLNSAVPDYDDEDEDEDMEEDEDDMDDDLSEAERRRLGYGGSGKNHRQDHQTRISNNFTPGGGDFNGRHSKSNSNVNNNINNGRHSRKSYSGGSTSLGNSKNRDRDANKPNGNSNGNIPFQKTVVVSLSPNAMPASGSTNHNNHIVFNMCRLFLANYFLSQLFL